MNSNSRRKKKSTGDGNPGVFLYNLQKYGTINITDRRDAGGCHMKLKNVLIVVKDMEKSIAFYRDLFGL